MDIAKVKEAQEVVCKAKRELEQIVKEYLETSESIKASFRIPLQEEDFADFRFNFQKDELDIHMHFCYHAETDEYDYEISCRTCKIFFFYPVPRKDCTAQGTLNVRYYKVADDGVKEKVKSIRLKRYNA